MIAELFPNGVNWWVLIAAGIAVSWLITKTDWWERKARARQEQDAGSSRSRPHTSE